MGTSILARRHLLDEPAKLTPLTWSRPRLCFADDSHGSGSGSGGGSGGGSSGGSGDGGSGDGGSGDGGGSDDGGSGGDDDAGGNIDWEARAKEAEAERDRWKSTSRKHEDRAKKNAGAARKLEEIETGQQGDQEKAVAAARREERERAQREFGGKLVLAEIRARAAGRMEERALDAVLDSLDAGRFLDDDGDVNTDKVRDLVEKIAPPKQDDGGHGRNGGQNGSARGGAGMGQGRTQRGRDGREGGGTAAGVSRYEQRKAARQPASAGSGGSGS